MRRSTVALFAVLLLCSLISPLLARGQGSWQGNDAAAKLPTKTPIKHVVVIFDENNSFDHYFGTYPHALNLPGEPRRFIPRPIRRS